MVVAPSLRTESGPQLWLSLQNIMTIRDDPNRWSETTQIRKSLMRTVASTERSQPHSMEVEASPGENVSEDPIMKYTGGAY